MILIQSILVLKKWSGGRGRTFEIFKGSIPILCIIFGIVRHTEFFNVFRIITLEVVLLLDNLVVFWSWRVERGEVRVVIRYHWLVLLILLFVFRASSQRVVLLHIFYPFTLIFTEFADFISLVFFTERQLCIYLAILIDFQIDFIILHLILYLLVFIKVFFAGENSYGFRSTDVDLFEILICLEILFEWLGFTKSRYILDWGKWFWNVWVIWMIWVA